MLEQCLAMLACLSWQELHVHTLPSILQQCCTQSTVQMTAEHVVKQVRERAAITGVLLGGENALPCFVPGGVDHYALDRIVYNSKPWSPPLQVAASL